MLGPHGAMCGNIGNFFLVAVLIGPELPLRMCIFKLREDKWNGGSDKGEKDWSALYVYVLLQKSAFLPTVGLVFS